jgi:hypothetical protein
MQRSCERGVEKLLPKKSKVLQLFWSGMLAWLLWTYATCLFMVKSPPNAAESTMSYTAPLLYFQLLWFMVLSYSTAMQFLSYSCTVFELLL